MSDSQTDYVKYENNSQLNLNNNYQSEYEQTNDSENQPLQLDDQITETPSKLKMNAHQQIIQQFRDRIIIKYVFLIGIISSGLMFYNNNFQGILKEQIIEFTGISQQKFQLLQSLSTGPVIPLILFSGPMNDILGLRNGMSFYFLIQAFGMWIATIGGYQNSFTLLLIGKILNNAGIELGLGARSSLTAKWFQGGNLALYNSLFLTLTKITQFTASLTYTRIYENYDSLFQPILVGALIATTCFCVNLSAFFTDYSADRQILKLQETEIQKVKKNTFKFSDLKQFSMFYWVVILTFGMNFGVYYPFIGNSTTIYSEKFNLTSKNTGDIQSINYFMGFFCSLVGLLIKKYQKSQFIILIFGNMCSIIFFSILIFHPGCEEACFDQLIFPVCIMGIYVMIFPIVLIPAIANASPMKIAGTAYGIAYASKNFTEAIIPEIGVGPLLEHSTIDVTLLLFLGLSIFCLILSVTLHIWFRKILKNQSN